MVKLKPFSIHEELMATATKSPFLLFSDARPIPAAAATAISPQLSSSSPSSSPRLRARRSSARPLPAPLHPLPQHRHDDGGGGSSSFYSDSVQDRQRHRTLLVDAFHRNNALRAVLREVSRKGSSAIRLLDRDGDWTSDVFWAVVAFLVEADRADEAVQVFEFWKKNEMTRNSVANYSKIIILLCERNLMEEAISTFEDMKKYAVVPSLATYNAIIHCFARNKDFDKSSALLDLMLETGVRPTPDTFNGIIQAYGSFEMYNEMSKCVKRMESIGCFPNEITYNILATKFAQGGLIEKMEGVHRILISKRMKLQPLTLVMILEAYADLGILDRMEKIYSRVINSKTFIGEGLIRKLAMVYIKNYRYSQLEVLGNDIGAKSGRTDLVWYILLLSSACYMSKKGVESIAREMEGAKVQLSVTYINIFALFYFRIKDFRLLHFALYQGVKNSIKPDIVTLGVLLDACNIGYDGRYILDKWRKNGYLEGKVELKTDHLALDAFGKGPFLTRCEELYLGLNSKEKEKRIWKYCDLLRLVFGT